MKSDGSAVGVGRGGQGSTQPQAIQDEDEQAPLDDPISPKTRKEHTLLGVDKERGEEKEHEEAEGPAAVAGEEEEREE